ncbi:hypothetical protein D9M68_760850 [compost metagenome]
MHLQRLGLHLGVGETTRLEKGRDLVAVTRQGLLHTAEVVARTAKRQRPHGEVTLHVLFGQALDRDRAVRHAETLQTLAHGKAGDGDAGGDQQGGDEAGNGVHEKSSGSGAPASGQRPAAW